MNKIHDYMANIIWTGNLGTGTSGYKDYARSYDISATGKPIILGSADPAFRGEALKWNPEDLLLSTIASCHMLWYLHFCADNHIIVEDYRDAITGKLEVDEKGLGKFIEATLNPVVRIKNSEQIDLAMSLHQEAHKFCFIANSLNFNVSINPSISAM